MTNSRPQAWRIYLIKLMLFAKKGGERREKQGAGRRKHTVGREGMKKGRKRQVGGREAGRAENVLVGRQEPGCQVTLFFFFLSSFLYF